jgi:hypothetical protein
VLTKEVIHRHHGKKVELEDALGEVENMGQGRGRADYVLRDTKANYEYGKRL